MPPYLDAAERRGTEVVYVSEEDRSLELGELELTLLAPAPLESDNERGIVACASVGEWDAVITGDAGMRAERLLIERGALGRAELLVAGHHGSRYSSSFELVERLRPETVVISVGYNSYGHPTEDAIFRLSCPGRGGLPHGRERSSYHKDRCRWLKTKKNSITPR